MRGLFKGTDEKMRCWWCEGDAQYICYHDEEWGVEVHDDIRLFEKISLEGFQAGLSWLTILRKRENFRTAFVGFDFVKIAHFNERDIERLMQDSSIVRHRGKIEAVIHNATLMPAITKDFSSFSAYVWRFKPPSETRPDNARYETLSDITQTDESRALSKDLKQRGFKFVGPTTMYAFMQSMGIVNDHIEGCWKR